MEPLENCLHSVKILITSILKETQATDYRIFLTGENNQQAHPKPTFQPKGSYKRPTVNPDDPKCPKCEGPMWDNTKDKRNPKAPDYKCKDKDCSGAVWLTPKSEAPAEDYDPFGDE